MKNKDIKAMSVNELKDRIEVEKKKLDKLKVAHKLTEIENPLRIKDSRKIVARLMTELTTKEKTVTDKE